jgi:glycosyltransferase involved in cell wall biosynthesis
LPSDVPLALWVGTTTFRKGFDSAVEAVEATRSFHLVVVGSSPSVKSNRVHVLGWLESRERLRDVFSACDAAIVTSYYEGFSVSVLEAMASGLALIVRNDSPVLETVPHENLLVVDTEAGFAAALSKLEGNLHLMKQLGLAARRCSEQFDVSVMTSRYRTIFENLVGSPGDVP